MQPHGSDRVRVAGGKVLLFSPIPKGWQPATPRTNTSTEHPGTTVLWDEQYYEVVAADAMQSGGVRYVLAPWRDEHIFRVFEIYDDASEARRLEEHRAVLAQQKKGKLVWLSGIVLGHLPAPVQNRLANDYGVAAPRMTLLSTIPSVVLLGVCVWLYAGARLRIESSPVPMWLWIVAAFMLADSAMRFIVFMTQNRAMGSFPGTLLYTILSFIAPRAFPLPREQGAELFTLAPDPEVAARDAIEMRAPLFTLLSPAEQARLAQRYGFEYRRHAFPPAIIILVGALIGAISSLMKVRTGGGISALISLVVAGALTVEQVLRLIALRRGPAGSMLAPLVRPFVRRYL
jgi:uncharacterized membrane protein YeaQ/YmgE (transglycosylase-associated protein family)